MEKKINNIIFVNTSDGRRLEYHVLFTHHCNKRNKDYVTFVNVENDDDILFFTYDENITLKEIEDSTEIEEMTEILKEFGEEMSNIICENDELMLSKLTTNMYRDIHENSLDEDNRKYVPDEVFETIEDAKNVVDYLMSCYESDSGPFVYAVIRKKDLKNIGYVQLIDAGEFYEVGYHIAKKYTNHGYATNALSLFLECLKENTNVSELYGICLKENIASVKVLEKCGFKKIYEGLGIYQGEEREIIKTLINLK